MLVRLKSLVSPSQVWAFAAAVERDPKGMEDLGLDCLNTNSSSASRTGLDVAGFICKDTKLGMKEGWTCPDHDSTTKRS